jgi:N-acetylmuramoyl-L-alanine amidase
MSRPPRLPATDSLIPGSPRRRTLLKAGGTLLLSVIAPLPASAAQILAVRVWPAPDYTRVTLENDSNPRPSTSISPTRRAWWWTSMGWA